MLDETLPNLLIAGSDQRAAPLPPHHLNKYGCSTSPRDALPLGSCTASSTSPRGYAAAERALEALRRGETEPRDLVDDIRQRLAAALDLQQVPGVEIALTPSGTDAEMLLTLIALGDRSSPVTNILVAPAEVGGGSKHAAGLRHFDALAPSGRALTPGDPVDPDLLDDVRVQTVRLRHPDGALRDDDELDGEVLDLARGALAEGHRVLVHVVAHSKTGAHAPRFEVATRLHEEHPDRVTVLVDAAQARVGYEHLHRSLARGFAVLFTGSKFLGGPPFSGALLLPASLAPPARPLSPPFADYFTRTELPASWGACASALPDTPNLGLLLRWQAALAELEAYVGVPQDTRDAIFDAFAEQVDQTLCGSDLIALTDLPRPPDPHAPTAIQRTPTVFSWTVHDPSGHRLDRDELRQLYGLLNTNLGHAVADDDPARACLARALHIGQPVGLGHSGELWVLRVAMGAPLVIQLADDTTLGASLPDRLAWLDAGVRCVRDKLEWLLHHRERWETL